MRLLIAAFALASIASPTQAQRVDTRRIDIHIAPIDHFANCAFTAVTGLRLRELGTDASFATASWSMPAKGSDDRGTVLQVSFEREQEDLSKTAVLVAGILVAMPPGAPRPASTHVLLDGNDSGAAFGISDSSSGKYIVNPVPKLLSIYANRLVRAQTAEPDLFGPSGASLASYRFDVRQLRRIPELLDLVHWSCTSPDR